MSNSDGGSRLVLIFQAPGRDWDQVTSRPLLLELNVSFTRVIQLQEASQGGEVSVLSVQVQHRTTDNWSHVLFESAHSDVILQLVYEVLPGVHLYLKSKIFSDTDWNKQFKAESRAFALSNG